jgi:hypothetical protein
MGCHTRHHTLKSGNTPPYDVEPYDCSIQNIGMQVNKVKHSSQGLLKVALGSTPPLTPPLARGGE